MQIWKRIGGWVILPVLLGVLVSLASAQEVQRPSGAATCPDVLEVRLTYRATNSTPDYVGATMSFEFGTRDDVKRVNNDWDICLQGRGTERSPYFFESRTVTDDVSDVWDAGAKPLPKVSEKSVKGIQPAYFVSSIAGVPVVAGHSYVLHTKDTDSDFWARFHVIEVVPESHVKLTWELLTKPKPVKKGQDEPALF